jgi:tellurite resistance-related uncharacterized protein
VIRSIVGFHLDEEGDWVAELDCYHNQHVRHRPPFQDRAWVMDDASRQARIGEPLECPLCDRAELPDGLVQQRQLGPWEEGGVPDALQRSHRTPDGMWGLLCILDGHLGFQFDEGEVIRLPAGARQAIPPGRTHRVILDGPVRLELQLWAPP